MEAWASLKSFRAKDGSDEPPAPGRNGESNFHGQKRANDTHESTTDPEAKLYRKGSSQPAKLYYIGHAMIENRHGLVVQADGDGRNRQGRARGGAGDDRPARSGLRAAHHDGRR